MTKPGHAGLLGSDYKPKARSALAGRFIAPPFSVLNAREGWWQERKRAWLSLGIRSEVGRGENLLKFSDSVLAAQNGREWGEAKKIPARGKAIPGGGTGKNSAWLFKGEDGYEAIEEGGEQTGTSIFDPVLCEIAYRWFAPEAGHVLDPFCGGSVRGIVAGELGLQYTGVDLRQEQVDANFKQADEIGTKPYPHWVAGDSRALSDFLQVQSFDFVFSCPPYGNLEVYSDDARDLSNMSAAKFSEGYREVILQASAMLKPGRFACFVVGDYRDKETGFYQNLPAQTIVYFEEAGLHLYNEIVLVTAIGSLPMRINKQFLGSRKTGKTHQNVLVFCKGQPKEFVKAWSGNLLEKEIK